MKLKGTFFEMVSSLETEGGLEAVVRIVPDNVIFKAHFPGHPITPGAVQVRMATEILEAWSGRKLVLSEVHDLKFVSPLVPGVDAALSFTGLSVGDTLETGLSIRVGENVVSRMTLRYSFRND